jgi:hypothetical protein
VSGGQFVESADSRNTYSSSTFNRDWRHLHKNLDGRESEQANLSVDKGEIQRAYYELEQLRLLTKQTGKDLLGKPRTDYRVAQSGQSPFGEEPRNTASAEHRIYSGA